VQHGFKKKGLRVGFSQNQEMGVDEIRVAKMLATEVSQ